MRSFGDSFSVVRGFKRMQSCQIRCLRIQDWTNVHIITAKHILILNLDCREVLCILCRQVSMFLLFLIGVWSKSIGPCQLLQINLHLVTLEQWFCCLCCLAFDLLKQLGLVGVSSS